MPRESDRSFDLYLEDLTKSPSTRPFATREKEYAVALRARDGDDEARNELISRNLRFVVSYVKKYRGRGLPLSELVALGNEGMVRAAETFNPDFYGEDEPMKFISYAIWWVRQAVLSELGRTTIHANPDVIARARRVDQAIGNLPRGAIDEKAFQELLREQGLTREKYHAAISAITTVSLDQPRPGTGGPDLERDRPGPERPTRYCAADPGPGRDARTSAHDLPPTPGSEDRTALPRHRRGTRP